MNYVRLTTSAGETVSRRCSGRAPPASLPVFVLRLLSPGGAASEVQSQCLAAACGQAALRRRIVVELLEHGSHHRYSRRVHGKDPCTRFTVWTRHSVSALRRENTSWRRSFAAPGSLVNRLPAFPHRADGTSYRSVARNTFRTSRDEFLRKNSV